MNELLPERFLRAGRGKGAQTPPPHPAPLSPAQPQNQQKG
jgi:hypothetical protein